MEEQRLTKAIQENLLVLLCFSDKHAAYIKNIVDRALFEGVYRDIVKRVYDYIEDYNQPPKEHLADLFDDVLEGDDEKKKQAFTDIFSYIYSVKDKVNVKYTLDRLSVFIRQQNLKIGIMEAANILQEGGEDAADRAEQQLLSNMKKVVDVFDIGLRADDFDRGFKFFEKNEESFPTGIEELDVRGLGPSRKALHLFVGGAKAGKSTWLCHLAKRALVSRLKVIYITLELSEDLVAQRIYQSFLAIPKRKGKYGVSKIIKHADGLAADFDVVEVNRPWGLSDDNAPALLRKKAARVKRHLHNLIIKEFPTGTLTVSQLKSYLDGLEDAEKFIPDLVLIDYADLMFTKIDNYRLELGNIYKELRGVAVERNIAIATASQSNREGIKKRRMTEVDVAEDFSKIATVDCVLTLSRTESEDFLDLARLFVAAARTDEGRFEILLTQAYAFAQFVIDSVLMVEDTKDVIENVAEREKNHRRAKAAGRIP